MNKRSLEISIDTVVSSLKLEKTAGEMVRALARTAYATGRVDILSELLEERKGNKKGSK